MGEEGAGVVDAGGIEAAQIHIGTWLFLAVEQMSTHPDWLPFVCFVLVILAGVAAAMSGNDKRRRK